jgi:hypothetical protein
VPQGLRALILKDLQICPDRFSESITDAVATTANDDNGEKVDGKDGNGFNDQRQISDAENGRENSNNNKIESNYEENKMKDMGDINNKSDDDEEKNDDTDIKKTTPRLN